ncbi:hemolysin family protein [Peribacillus sp. Hz7]|uniref:hemolysin family protein n=1 Tax=Peribacillus sp. Hz7 TaxID=3344873 RepID=UPI0035C9D98B
MDTFNLILVILLIALTAFFVASEFSIIRVRSSRIDQLIEEGNKNAMAAKKVISNLDEYLSATQLGITIAALGLGWLGEPTVLHLIKPWFDLLHIPAQAAEILSFIIAFSLITFLNVVVGELAPKTVAIQKAEQVTLLLAKPLLFFHKIAFPFIWLLNHSARAVVKMLGFKQTNENEAHSEEELRFILSDSYENGEINQSEFKYVSNIFEFDDRLAKEIMVPRTEILTISKDEILEDFVNMAKQERYTRYPVVEGDKDHVIGLVNLKEVFADLIKKQDNRFNKIETYTRPIIRVMENIPIHDLLLKMQKERIHMAIVMDEYGGTAGLVTVEDILEEIVGEIRDEFDNDEVPSIQVLSDGHYILDAKLLVKEVNDLLDLEIDDEDIDTIGGWILTENYDVSLGDIIQKQDFAFKVIEMEDHTIKFIEVQKVKQPILQVDNQLEES